MSARAWVASAALVGAVLLNAVLVVQEELPDPEKGPELGQVEEVLKHLRYVATARRSNFLQMGMDDELAEAAARRIDKYVGLKDKFREILSDQAVLVGDAFCSTTGLPQPYAATRFLVREENTRRDVVDTSRLLTFEDQPWYSTSPVRAVYTELELTEGRKGDATLMGVAGVLLGREADVLDGTAPWSRGLMGSWGFAKLQKQNPRAQILVIEYFSLMHYLTELANTRDGICS